MPKLDSVSDPAYNMQGIIKQSILLEEHLSNDNKYCRDCVAKHFLHIIGLAEEAQSLAGKRLHHYKYLEDAPAFYKQVFDAWRAKKRSKPLRQQAAEDLRKHRKLLQKEYV